VARAHCNIYLATLCLNFLSIILMLPHQSFEIAFVHGFYGETQKASTSKETGHL
jgi:hypothetical protein